MTANIYFIDKICLIDQYEAFFVSFLDKISLQINMGLFLYPRFKGPITNYGAFLFYKIFKIKLGGVKHGRKS